jgi:streptogramin lyase
MSTREDRIQTAPDRLPGNRSIILVSVLVAAGGAVALFATLGGDRPTTDSVAATFNLDGQPVGMTYGGEDLWISVNDPPDFAAGRLVRLNPGTGDVQSQLDLGGDVSFSEMVGDELWVVVEADGFDQPIEERSAELIAVDARTGEVTGRIDTGADTRQLVLGEGKLWAANGHSGAVIAIDPAERIVVGSPIQVGGWLLGIDYADGAVWVTLPDEGQVARIDLTSNNIDRIDVGGFPVGVVVTTDGIYVADPDRGLIRIDPQTLQVGDPTDLGGASFWPVSDGKSVWIGTASKGIVTRIDAATGARVGPAILIESSPSENGNGMVAIGGESVWAAGNQTVVRIDPDR